MTYYEFCKVKNNLLVNNKKTGRQVRVINITTQQGEDHPIWINNLDSLAYIKAGMTIKCIRGTNNKFTVVEDETSNRSNGSDGSNTISTQTYSQLNGNGYSSPSNSEEDILDLPVFSQRDKQAMAQYIKSQSKLLRYCYEVSAEQFPEMKGTDERGLRSLAISLLISANQCRDRYLK